MPPATVHALIDGAVARFTRARLVFGHGTTNAWDEAVYLVLHALKLPPDRLTPYLARKITAPERTRALRLIDERIRRRVPAAYLTHEAWLGDYRFYVDERVIVPRSYIAELLRERLAPWIAPRRRISPCARSVHGFRLSCHPACQDVRCGTRRCGRYRTRRAGRRAAQYRRLSPATAHTLAAVGHVFRRSPGRATT